MGIILIFGRFERPFLVVFNSCEDETKSRYSPLMVLMISLFTMPGLALPRDFFMT